MPTADVVVLAVTEYDITRLVDRVFRATLIHDAINGLREERPDLSASQVFTPEQLIVLGTLLVGLAAGLT